MLDFNLLVYFLVVYKTKMCMFIQYTLFYKQLGSGPQSCWYFQDFQGSKLLISCLVNWLNTVNAKYFTVSQYIPKILGYSKFKAISRKHMKVSKNVVLSYTLFLQYCKNYPQLIFIAYWVLRCLTLLLLKTTCLQTCCL